MKFEIKSDGTTNGTSITIDGAKLENVERVVFVHRAGKLPRVIVHIWSSDLEIEAADADFHGRNRVIEVS